MVTKMQALSMMGGTASISGLIFYLIGYCQGKKYSIQAANREALRAGRYHENYKKIKDKYALLKKHAQVISKQ